MKLKITPGEWKIYAHDEYPNRPQKIIGMEASCPVVTMEIGDYETPNALAISRVPEMLRFICGIARDGHGPGERTARALLKDLVEED